MWPKPIVRDANHEKCHWSKQGQQLVPWHGPLVPDTGEAEVGGSLQPTDPRIDQQHRETLTENKHATTTKQIKKKHKPTLTHTKTPK